MLDIEEYEGDLAFVGEVTTAAWEADEDYLLAFDEAMRCDGDGEVLDASR